MSSCKPYSSPMIVKSSSTPNSAILSLIHLFIGLLSVLFIKRLFRYLKGTLTHGLQFSSGPLLLHAYSDYDWASDSLDRCSTTG
ncbi:uncharacterized protein LOC114280610 [Camellia sinensis]|uniref:uncharacterized protein LOC114280610 n=1 Tax=Camellia sinensis TaxID=4442 RepID=UPI0010365194|nr:uncharacterized protein LOC114280610 [Camellia sinensis]